MRVNKIQWSKIKRDSLLNDRAFYLKAMEEGLGTLLDLLEDPLDNNTTTYSYSPNMTHTADPFDWISGNQPLTAKQKMEETLNALADKGEQFIAEERYEMMKALHHDYNTLIKIYEQNYGPFKRREAGDAGTANGQDGPSEL